MRLFVALDFADWIHAFIRELVATELRPLYKSARWVRPEGMHVTLKFIGHVPAEKLDPIRAALANVRSSAPVEMTFHGLGFFPSERRPRVLWCGIEASRNLASLAKDIESVLAPLGVPTEDREFVPHLTLARFESPRDLDQLIARVEELKSLDPFTARERQFHLYESTLKPSGAEYKKLESFAFVKGAV
jgi:2'-5' RNA ligase